MSDKPNQLTMSRRQLIHAAAATAAAAVLATPAASAAENEHHHHGKNPYSKLVETAQGCTRSGQACLDHCMNLFKTGDTTVAACADSVVEMLAMTTALQQLASAQSKHIKAFAAVCKSACDDCAKECEKHADKHDECKACMDACKDCAKACGDIV